MIEVKHVFPVQGETETGHELGYIHAGDGGYFFTWKYTPDAADDLDLAIDQIATTIEPDEVDPPTGTGNTKHAAARALGDWIRRNGLRKIPSWVKAKGE